MPISPLCNSFALLDTSSEEVERFTMNLKSDCAAGVDGITTRVLKMAKTTLVPFLVCIFNSCFKKAIFPDVLKKSIVVPIYKGGGERKSIDNYRPILLLPVISKILEKIINTRLMNYLESNHLISNSQFGFRTGRSAEDAVHELTDFLIRKINVKTKCLTIFMDLRKAFDTVSFSHLQNKLEHLGIRGEQLIFLCDYLHNRTQKVKIGGNMSEEIRIECGVPQGSILGPSLFLCYINEVCELKIDNCKIISYADDTTPTFYEDTWVEVYKTAQKGFDKVCQWLAANSLSLNTTKTKYITFSSRNNLKDTVRNLNIFAHNSA
jgi:hypothetical protein